MHLRFCEFPKNSELLFIKPRHHRLHISELKYAPTHGTFPSYLEIDKTAGAYSSQIYDYLSQIQHETNAFLLIVRHNTEVPPFSDWHALRRLTLFFFVGLKNRVNLGLFFKPWPAVLPLEMLVAVRITFPTVPPYQWCCRPAVLPLEGLVAVRIVFQQFPLIIGVGQNLSRLIHEAEREKSFLKPDK